MALTLRTMTQGECVSLLEQSRCGHLACCSDGQPYIVPIYFSYDKGVLYSFSMPGQKIDWMRANSRVCLQTDHLSDVGWQSVVVTGEYEEFPDTDLLHSERMHAWSLLQRHSDWWEMGSLKPEPQAAQSHSPHIFYGILIREMAGRAALSGD
ncbi:flavin-nucleotide-binding protein [Rhizobium sullae]|uniref:Flavin-nucleotide-binding protein n=1 Tax=Rhizobium sullae TaxID=50338 RepID=A0A2N0DB74_RHISU|nr:pyridoxamine 5'-phosphate oxidase family protein [Rhizobium sullae]PKA43324.1 flavin-nucleotide-binding protein [Rhizobium sullae]